MYDRTVVSITLGNGSSDMRSLRQEVGAASGPPAMCDPAAAMARRAMCASTIFCVGLTFCTKGVEEQRACGTPVYSTSVHPSSMHHSIMHLLPQNWSGKYMLRSLRNLLPACPGACSRHGPNLNRCVRNTTTCLVNAQVTEF